jgi:hypothetical protein
MAGDPHPYPMCGCRCLNPLVSYVNLEPLPSVDSVAMAQLRLEVERLRVELAKIRDANKGAF